jgi:TolA-binding protein
MKTCQKFVNASAGSWRAAIFYCALASLVSARICALSFADTITVRSSSDSPTAKPTVFTDAKVSFVENGQMTFTTGFGTTATKSMSAILSVSLDDEPAFNAAQQDYAAKNYDRAVDEFDQTLQKTDKTWLQAFCWPTFTDAANRAGRFDKAVQGYAWLVLNNSPEAARQVPVVPAAGSPTLDAAATALQTAVASPSISPAQSVPLLALLLNVQRARGDAKSVEEIAGQLGGLVTDPNDPNARLALAAIAEARIMQANDAISKGDFDGAAAFVNSSRGLFTDQSVQASAMFILAQVAEAHAKAADTADTWRDAAIAYMRVAADFKDVSGAPHVPQSLLMAAGILEKHLNEPDKSLHLYQSISAQYAGTAMAGTAAEQAARLKAAGIK